MIFLYRLAIGFLFFLLTSHYINAQTITWQKSYRGLGPVGFETLASIVQTPDSGFISVGNTRPGGGASTFMMAIRTNKFGDSVWFKKFDFVGAVKIIRVFDGNYVMASLYGDLIKININGDTLWTKRIGNSNIRINSLRESNTQGLIAVGSIGFSINPFLRKCDSHGNLLWERTFMDYPNSELTDVAFDEKNFVLSGYKILNSHLQLIFCDFEGSIYKEKTFDSPWFKPTSLVILSDGQLVLGGTSKPLNEEGISASLMKLDTALNKVWHYTYDEGEPQFGYCSEMILTYDGGYAIVGSTSRDSVYVLAPMARLIKTDYAGNLRLYKKFGFDSSSAGNLDGACISQTIDGGFVIGGSRDIGDYSYHLVKTDSSGFAEPVGIFDTYWQLNKDFFLFQNYPNPFNSSTTIKIAMYRTSFLTINLYNLQGRKVKTIASGSYKEGVHRFTVSSEELPSGIYFYVGVTGEFRTTKKLIIVK